MERRQPNDLHSSSKDRIVALRDKYSTSTGSPADSPPSPPPVSHGTQPVAQTSHSTTADASRSAQQQPDGARSPEARGARGYGTYVIGVVVAVATIFVLLLLAASCSDPGYYY